VQGSPGSSYTYEVAEKSGIHKELIIRAKEKLQDSVIEVDRLLVNIQDEKQSLELKSAQLTLQLQELNTLKIKQEERIKRLEEKVERQTEINVAQSEYLMWGKRFQALVNMWEQKPTTENKKIIGGRFWKMMQERSAERLSKKAEEKSAEGHKNQKKLEKLLTAPIAVGDSVKLIDSHMRGVVQEIKKDKYQINFGNMSSLLDREKFIPFIKEAPKKSKKSRSND
jgi:DNA mismatch repair protein MutS2